jgi:hypothetical protein
MLRLRWNDVVQAFPGGAERHHECSDYSKRIATLKSRGSLATAAVTNTHKRLG